MNDAELLQQLVTLVQSLKADLEALKDGDQALWDIADVARYFKCQDSTAYKIVARKGFPDPVAAAGVRSHPRWISGQVKEFAAQAVVPRRRSPETPLRVVRRPGRPRTGATNL